MTDRHYFETSLALAMLMSVSWLADFIITDRLEPQALVPEPKAVVAKPEIYVHYAPFHCPPCEQFKSVNFDGAKFSVVPKVHSSPKHYPYIYWQAADGGWLYLETFTSKADLIARWELSQKPVVKYPTQSRYNWTGPVGHNPLTTKQQAIDHLLMHPEHGNRFVRDFLQKLSLAELQAIHSDDHDRRIKTFYRK